MCCGQRSSSWCIYVSIFCPSLFLFLGGRVVHSTGQHCKVSSSTKLHFTADVTYTRWPQREREAIHETFPFPRTAVVCYIYSRSLCLCVYVDSHRCPTAAHLTYHTHTHVFFRFLFLFLFLWGKGGSSLPVRYRLYGVVSCIYRTNDYDRLSVHCFLVCVCFLLMQVTLAGCIIIWFDFSFSFSFFNKEKGKGDAANWAGGALRRKGEKEKKKELEIPVFFLLLLYF